MLIRFKAASLAMSKTAHDFSKEGKSEKKKKRMMTSITRSPISSRQDSAAGGEIPTTFPHLGVEDWRDEGSDPKPLPTSATVSGRKSSPTVPSHKPLPSFATVLERIKALGRPK